MTLLLPKRLSLDNYRKKQTTTPVLNVKNMLRENILHILHVSLKSDISLDICVEIELIAEIS